MLPSFLFLFSIAYCKAQNNLVLNPSFEQYDTCPGTLTLLEDAVNWRNPNVSSPDYFNECAIGAQCHVPNNIAGFQYAKDGSAYSGIGTTGFAAYDQREYAEGKLISPLDSNKRYKIEFFVSYVETSNLISKDFGVLFGSHYMFFNTQYLIPDTPQLKFHYNFTQADTANWVGLTDTFTATGGEQYFIIGNFITDSLLEVDTLPHQSWQGLGCYFYIDDVSITEYVEDTTHHGGGSSPPLIIPNLLSTETPLWQIINMQSTTSVTLYNTLGQLVYKNKEYNNSLNITKLAAATYFYEVKYGSKTYRGKLVVVR